MIKEFSSAHIVLIAVGILFIGGVFLISQKNPVDESVVLKEQVIMLEDKDGKEENNDMADQNQDSEKKESRQITDVSHIPIQEANAPEEKEVPSSSTSSDPVLEETTQSEPEPDPDPVPEQIAYDPGFEASVRVTPEIPSEDERALLPMCEGKVFSLNPVNLGAVTSIDASGTFAEGDPEAFAWLHLPTTSDLQEYDATAPQDVYVTHLTQEQNVSADPEDNTIYFALCRDVFAYVTHVKELSENIQKILTDSACFSKPHVGENACHIEVLDLIGRGSLLGKAGWVEGRVGFGVIDLRKERGLENPQQYSVKTNFATCPFDYFANPSGYYDKLTASTSLCQKQ